MRSITCWSALLAALLIAAPAAGQQPADPRQSRERELLRRQSEEIRGLESERARLNTDRVRLEDELKKSRAQAAAAGRNRTLQTKLDAVETELAAAVAERDRLREELAAATKVSELQRRELAELRAAVAAANERSAGLDTSLKARTESLQACAASNTKVVAYGNEILDKLSDGSCKRGPQARWDPVLQLGRVRFELQVEEFRDRIAAERFQPAP